MDLNNLSLNRIKKLSSTWGVKGRSKMNKKQLQNALEKMLMTVLQNDEFDLYEEMLRDFSKKEVKKTSRKQVKTSRMPKKVNRKTQKKSSKDKAFNIYIKTLDGKTNTIKTKSNDTIKDIMKKIRKVLDISLQIILIYEKKRLPQIEENDVNRKLSEFNIESECTLHLIYRLGPPSAPFKYKKSEWFPKKVSRKPKKVSRKPMKSRKPKKVSRKPMKSRKPKKVSRKPMKSRKPKKASRKPMKSRKPKKVSRKPKRANSNLIFLDKKLIDIKNDIKKIDTDIKKAQQLQKDAQKLLNKITKLQNPSEIITQDIEYNEGLIIDLEKDIGKLTQKKYELDDRHAFLKMLYIELNRNELSTQLIHQLKYSISKLNDKELQKKLMTVLQTKK